jgi:ankyrin repeat protein
MLVAAGGSLSQKDAQGQTPRELALIAGDQELANYLKSKLIALLRRNRLLRPTVMVPNLMLHWFFFSFMFLFIFCLKKLISYGKV